MSEAPVLLLRTTKIRGARPEDELRACFACKVELVLTPQRRPFLVEGARFACVGCLGAIPRSAQILGPRAFTYEELSDRSGVAFAAPEAPPVERVPEPAHRPETPSITEPKEEPVSKKKAALEPRRCALESCGVTFTPGRINQRFHSPACKIAFFEAEKKNGRYSKEKDVPEKKPKKERAPRALNHQPIDETAPTATSSPRTSSSTRTGIAIATDVHFSWPQDPEIAAITALAALEPAARARVVEWARSRWGE